MLVKSRVHKQKTIRDVRAVNGSLLITTQEWEILTFLGAAVEALLAQAALTVQ